MSKKDERKFLEVVKSIRESENDVDKILEAARLMRHEDANHRLSGEQKYYIILCSIICTCVVAVLSVLCLWA